MQRVRATIALLFAVYLAATPTLAQKKPASSHKEAGRTKRNIQKSKKALPQDPLVAYDKRDHRYYLLSWAKAHRMRDPGGDSLILLPLSKLPPMANPAIVPPRP